MTLPTTQGTYPYPNEPTWTRSEKTMARAVFDGALKRELLEVMQEAKQKVNQIKEPSDMWELEHYLTLRRKDIDRRYDSRSSRLTHVLGRLLSERRINEQELRGIREDRMKTIRSCAELLSEDAA
jgi:hypothetical protein